MINNWPFDATQFTYLSLTCLLLSGVAWYLLRDSAELFQGANGNTDQLVPTTLKRALGLVIQAVILITATVAAGLWLCGRAGIHPLALAVDNRLHQTALSVIGRGLLWGLLVSLVFDGLRFVLFRKHLSDRNTKQ